MNPIHKFAERAPPLRFFMVLQVLIRMDTVLCISKVTAGELKKQLEIKKFQAHSMLFNWRKLSPGLDEPLSTKPRNDDSLQIKIKTLSNYYAIKPLYSSLTGRII